MKLWCWGLSLGALLCVQPVVFAAGGHHHVLKTKQAEAVLQPFDVNKATIKDWQHLKGVGKQTAHNIVAYQKAHGSFKQVGDLRRVKNVSSQRIKGIAANNHIHFAVLAKH